MKTSAAVLAAVLAMGPSLAHAQSDGSTYFGTPAHHRMLDIAKAEEAYKCCLESANPGVQESAIAHLVWLKLQRPDANLTPLRPCFDRLAVSGATTSVRYRAYLATLLLDSSEIFSGIELQTFENDQKLFEAMTSRLQKTLLGYSDRRYVRER